MPDTVAWEPIGDGLESLRVHPAVTQAIDQWLQNHPLLPTQATPDAPSATTPQTKNAGTMLDLVDGAVREAYRRAVVPSRSIAAALHVRAFVRWWLAFALASLGVTVATAAGTWAVIARLIGFPTATSTIIWAVHILLPTIGLIVACSVLSFALGLLWDRHVSHVWLRTVKVVTATAMWGMLMALVTLATPLWLVINLSDYLPIRAWWEGTPITIVASACLGGLSFTCLLNASDLAHDWTLATRQPHSLAETLVRGRSVLTAAASALEELAQQNIPQAETWPMQVKLAHLTDLTNSLAETVMPQVGVLTIHGARS